MKTAIVIGSTGLVGRQLVQLLINDNAFSVVKVFARRSLGIKHPKLTEVLCDFDHLEEVESKVNGDVLFSCMGTTLKQAGGKKQQFKVDFTYQYDFARIASNNGVKQYVLVSSMSANPKSNFFYLRMKGELEEAIKQLPFKGIHIIQPSGLIGERENNRKREQIGIKVTDAIISVLPFLRKYRGIPAQIVVKAMVNLSKNSDATKKVVVTKLEGLFKAAGI